MFAGSMKATGWIAAATALVVTLPILLVAVIAATLVPAATSATACTTSGVVAGGWRVPLVSPFRITSRFGMRFHPILQRSKLHTGIDLVPAGDRTVVAAAEGTVATAGFHAAYGNQVLIDHGDGLQTRYAHLATHPTVTAGQQVASGARLGVAGRTGYATGIHLHYEVIQAGRPIDPEPFMTDHGASLDGATSQQDALPVVADASTSPDELTATRGDGQRVRLRGEQVTHAATIVTVGRDLQVSERGIVVALMAALQESVLRNLPYGDRDSLGLFQQRAGWGTATERQTPTYAARAFYGGPDGPNHGHPPGLLDTDGWETMSPGQAAQAVQVSAYPSLYDRWEPIARTLLNQVAGSGTGECALPAVGGLRVATWNLCLEFCPELGPWRQRVPVIAAQLLATGADVIALQETGRKNTHGDTLARAVSSRYRVAAYHRSKMLLINPDRVRLTNTSGRGLPGRDFLLGNRGGVAQVLRLRVTGAEVVVTSLHPAHGSTVAADRERLAYLGQAQAIADGLSAYGRRPIVHIGDLNSHIPGSRTHHRVATYLTGLGYRSAEQLAEHREGARYASYNGGHPPVRGRRIDHIIVPASSHVTVWRQLLAPDPQHPPSDHHLIVADLDPAPEK